MQQFQVVASPQDKRHYRRLRLDNGLHVLLISDPEISLPEVTDESQSEDSASLNSENDGSIEGEDASEDGEGGRDRGPSFVKQAAAALAVGIGSLSDPQHLPGLSHYLEHMLFMSSEKYPDENEYDAYISNNGGMANAYTELEYTNYHFEVNPKALSGALDRFAQFFVAPLCKADALEREVQAVDNEFIGVMQRDSERLAQLRCHTSRSGHPYKTFFWGNMKSLWQDPRDRGVDVRQELQAYYRKHYRAERMCLAVLGGQSLGQLQDMVTQMFGSLPVDAQPAPSFERFGTPFEAGRLHILPAVKTGHHISATFALPPLLRHYRTKPEDYLSHLVGHEGQGSLLSALKHRGWATQLQAGVADGGVERSSCCYLFDVSVQLTEAGLQAGPGMGLAVIGLLFQYLGMLQREGLQSWAYAELAAIATTKFQYANEEEACDYVTRLAADMLHYEPEHTLNADSLFEGWDAELVGSLLDHMTPANLRLDLQSSAFDTIMQSQASAELAHEPWFKLPYTSLPIPRQQVQQWQAALQGEAAGGDRETFVMPVRNVYIPTDFQLVGGGANHCNGDAHANGGVVGVKRAREAAQAHKSEPHSDSHASQAAFPTPPSLIADGAGLRVWHRALGAIQLPKAAAYFTISGLHMEDTPASAAALHLLLKLVRDSLNEQTYLADLAGLQYEMSPEGPAFDVQVDGFSHKLPVLTDAIFSRLASFQVCEERFKAVHEALVLQYRNACISPDRHAAYLRLRSLKRMWSTESVLAAMEGLTPSKLQALQSQLLSDLHIEALFLGNISAGDAVSVAKAVQRQLAPQLQSHQRVTQGVVQLPDGHSYLHRQRTKNEQEDNSVVEVYYQVGPDSIQERACAAMLEQCMSEPFYNMLRTKEQLGYSVHASFRLTHGALGISCTVVSGVHGPAHLDARIEAFVHGYAATLEAMPEAEWEGHRQALIQAKMQKDGSIGDEAERFWELIASRRYNMCEREQEVQALQGMTHGQLCEWYRRHLAATSPHRRRLAVHVLMTSSD
ncbi:hypothetical protein WJX73_004607 [Symbiochloris irregularis]|uniref:Insulin-degrading enzyme n=1 Tax=Symbiochloris irregularis TaxID=706552 RepID=A0AAW1NWN9_9CHLO